MRAERRALVRARCCKWFVISGEMMRDSLALARVRERESERDLALFAAAEVACAFSTRPSE